MRTNRVVTALLAFGLAVPAATLDADVKYLRCESGTFGRYRECPAKTDGRVELVRELSRNRCTAWRSWGYDRNGIWVDNGCRAEFRVGKEDGGIGVGTGVAIGAVAGAAILGAILANKKSDDHKHEAWQSPEWARGRFRGFSPVLETDFDITIDRDGKVSGTSDGKAVSGHLTENNRLHLGDLEFSTGRETWGFVATQRDDDKNVIYFRRPR